MYCGNLPYKWVELVDTKFGKIVKWFVMTEDALYILGDDGRWYLFGE